MMDLEQAIKSGKYSFKDLTAMFPDHKKTTIILFCQHWGLRKCQKAVWDKQRAALEIRLERLWHDGYSDREIAEELGLTKFQVAAVRRKRDLIRPVDSTAQARKRVIGEAWRRGKTDEEISRLVPDMSVKAIQAFRTRNGFTSDKGEFKPAMMTKLTPYFQCGAKTMAIHKETGIDRGTIRKYRIGYLSKTNLSEN